MLNMLEHRVPPPLLMLGIGAAMGLALLDRSAAAFGPELRWGTAAVCFAGGGVFALPAFRAFAAARTTINPVAIDQASSLVTSGIYRVTRNPMYVGLTLLLCAWGFWLGRPIAALGPLTFVAFIDRLQIVPEERALTARFGQAYADYRRRVRRWL